MSDDIIRLTAKQEAFAQAVVKNGGDKVAAHKEAGYSLSLNASAMGVQADKTFNNPNVNLRITQLQKAASIVAKKRFNCTVESLLGELEESRAMAMEERQASAATSATMGKAKLTGLDQPIAKELEEMKSTIETLIKAATR